MATCFDFHPDALSEYSEAALYYLENASPEVACHFVNAIEAAISSILAAPERFRVVDTPDIRRVVVTRFPYVVYYRWEAEIDRLLIHAVMHSSREPSYWRHRIS